MILFFNHPSSPEEDEKDKKWILCSSVIAMPNETHSHNETELSFYIFEIFCWVFFFSFSPQCTAQVRFTACTYLLKMQHTAALEQKPWETEGNITFIRRH